jgi:23S rRNA (adenine2030-N6)-methyltransferase
VLSYRHGFHAGNHADVLKHCVLALCLDYLVQKPKPLLVLDTHAGAGLYRLDGAEAGKNREFAGGIGRLWGAADAPDELAPWLDVVRRFNPDGALRFYPGSALIAATLTRPDDPLHLFERHPRDVDALREHLGGDRRIRVQHSDGFAALKALLPPPSRRGLILIDPPYEQDSDYKQVLTALQDGLQRFAQGAYLVWYPLLSQRASQKLPERLRALPDTRWLSVELRIQRPSSLGLWGSGMHIVNPPWQLQTNLAACLPYLRDRLGTPGQSFRVSVAKQPL